MKFFPLVAEYNTATDGLGILFPKARIACEEGSLLFSDTRLNKNGLPQILYDLRDNLVILYKGCVELIYEQQVDKGALRKLKKQTDKIVEQLSLQK